MFWSRACPALTVWTERSRFRPGVGRSRAFNRPWSASIRLFSRAVSMWRASGSSSSRILGETGALSVVTSAGRRPLPAHRQHDHLRREPEPRELRHRHRRTDHTSTHRLIMPGRQPAGPATADATKPPTTNLRDQDQTETTLRHHRIGNRTVDRTLPRLTRPCAEHPLRPLRTCQRRLIVGRQASDVRRILPRQQRRPPHRTHQAYRRSTADSQMGLAVSGCWSDQPGGRRIRLDTERTNL